MATHHSCLPVVRGRCRRARAAPARRAVARRRTPLLTRAAQRAARADHVTAVTGGWAHDVVLRSDAPVEVALWCPGDRPYPELEATAARVAARAVRACRISERVLARIQPEATAPALLSVVRLPRWEPARVLTGAARLVLVADGIEYAGNLGSLVRTADACAVDALVLTRATARVTHPKVFAASRGTVLTTPVLTYATSRRRGRSSPTPASPRTSRTRRAPRRTAPPGSARAAPRSSSARRGRA